MKYTTILVMMGVGLIMPLLVSANGLRYSEESRSIHSSSILKVQEWKEERGGISYGSEMFRDSRDRSSDSEKDTRSYSEPLGPSFDIPKSVDGHSRAVDPWWERRSSADPMVEDLSRKDGGGFSSPGDAGGSVPGYHGR